jgi:hypothetical protein
MAISVLPKNDVYEDIERALEAVKNDAQALYQAIVNAPFAHDRDMAFLFLGFICFFWVDSESNIIRAGAATDNEYFKQSIANYNFTMDEYQVPLSETENSIVQAVISGKPVTSTNWDSFRRPDVEEGVARLNQANSGIGYSAVYPVTGKIKGALMFNFYQFPEAIGEGQATFMEHYSNLVSKALA